MISYFKNGAIGLVLALSVLCSSGPASATINDFTGTWTNTNADTRGMTRIKVKRMGGAITVQAWGSCSPNDCDWGTVSVTPYAGSASADALGDTASLVATFDQGFSEKAIVMTRQGSKLVARLYTKFTDDSGRTAYTTTDTFKELAVFTPLAPGLGVISASPPANQDCISFNPNNAVVAKAGNRWKIKVGSMWLLDFGSNQSEAQEALTRIKSHNMNKQCFVGRPNPSFKYYLSGNAAPANASGGEDCLNFNNANVEVKKINNRWKIVDGSHWMFDFKGKEAEARKAYEIIKYYGFSKTCYVGRPGPSLSYLLK